MIRDFLSSATFDVVLDLILIIIGVLLVILFAHLAFFLWDHYKNEKKAVGIPWTLLEIVVPREIVKTPAAMELVYSNTIAPKLWFSLELVSIGGKIHFYIRTPTSIKDLIETQIYAQYPQAKVFEVEDYAFKIPEYTKDGNWYTWGCEFKKKKEDFLPIKTYKGFGEDMRTGIKEEFKVDPITPTIEFMGSLTEGQQMWVQILVRINSKKYYSEKKKKKIEFYDAGQEFLDKMFEPYQADAEGKIKAPKNLELSAKAVSEQLGQLHFDCGIRLVTLSDKNIVSEDLFNNLRRSSRLIFRQYSSFLGNQFERVNSTEFENAWADPNGTAVHKAKARMLDFYRMRTFFHPSLIYDLKYPSLLAPFFPAHKPEVFVLSNEELATIYHFPGMVSETPSFKRVDSKIAKPPSNLPI
jgi:hypothetical protein